jgi:cobalt-zinc-cadmium efflux system membrane fusion protein
MITHDQFVTDSMALGSLAKQSFDEAVECKGYVVPMSGGFAKLYVPIPGIVQKLFCNDGQTVQKGQALFEISGNEIIDLQNSFTESASVLSRLKSEYKRIESLFKENVGSEKDFNFALSEYKAALSKYKALRAKIELTGLNADYIENGELYSSYKVKAPISGNISHMNVALGMYADQQSILLEIVDPDHLQLNLSVFAVDIAKLKTGQKVNFRFAGEDNDNCGATLQRIGRSVNPETQAINCFAGIADMDPSGEINNAFVDASIIVNSVQVYALPADALIKSGEDMFYLVLEKEESGRFYFQKVKATTGRRLNNFVEILNAESTAKILVKGVYNIVID